MSIFLAIVLILLLIERPQSQAWAPWLAWALAMIALLATLVAFEALDRGWL